MKKMDKNYITSSMALTLLLIILLASTYAFFTTTEAVNTSFDARVSTNTTDSLVFETGGPIDFTIKMEDFDEGMGNQEGSTFLKATLKANNKTNQASSKYFVYLDITENEFIYSSRLSQGGLGGNEMLSSNNDNSMVMPLSEIGGSHVINPELILQITDPTGKVLSDSDITNLNYASVVDGLGETISGFDITGRIGRFTIASNYEINTTSETSQDWQFKIIFVNLSTDQRDNVGKKINADLIIKKEESQTLQQVANYYYNEKLWQHKDKIKNIIIEKELNSHENAVYTYDISLTEDNSVMSYLVDNGDETYTAYIQADGKIKANQDSSFLFAGFTKLESITGLENLDTSNVVDMGGMFAIFQSTETGIKSEEPVLTALDLSSLDTSKVTNMRYMFYGCSSLTSLDVSNFDTSNVTNMHSMFEDCRGLTSLDLSNFDTSQVTDMNSMFYRCSGLTSLDLNNFDTSKITDISNMFSTCSGLTNLDLSNAVFEKVTKFDSMFSGVPETIIVITKDEAAKEFIDARLAENADELVEMN